MNSSLRVASFLFTVGLLSVTCAAQEDATSKAKTKKKKASAPFQWVNPLPEKHHAALTHATFRSSSMDIDVGYVIMLPPDYQRSPDVRFPVVYYLHGGRPGNELKSIRLADTIYAAMDDGDVSQAIYVFVNGGPVSHYNMPGDPSKQGASVFVKELIPHVDATYRTVAKRSGRALEGFSQGGRGTMRLSLRYPGLFCSAAAGGGGYEAEKRISEEDGYENPGLRFAAGDNTWDLARTYAKRKTPVVRWMLFVGDKGINYENNLAYMKFLDSLGIKYGRIVVPGAEHSAKQIYESEALSIIRFHAKNFVKAATWDAHDGQQGIPIRVH
ncbi:alpha/beta hydrolase [Planctomycetes bacterium K23_9]|uniref:Esterase n=1 Tax=Stieleria marina TaxID=1930275 RepID=A0A517NRQ3_9BACT|nr:Putative esterase [Planctomycetes bacterium K23_9]